MLVHKTLENARNCKCLQCPSYTTTCKIRNKMSDHTDVLHRLNDAHWELLFCAFEKSNCIHENRGCLCSSCAVHKKYALNNEDYCLHSGGVV
ncbi:DUF2769 domain-containing protein [bacterium]|nr:DUF2769 domain-containing protein [bacterium]MBR2274323.1 DUF2769 domain-containing protein [Alphaproteobacteria bacterium]